jgi:alkylation response protein AidB-like acyl-CoA dehydrogenase
VLRQASEGRIFAAGHGEGGNDLPVVLSSTKAERVKGGWEFTGHKIFGSLSPVWDYLGIHGMDVSDAANPQIVHAFVDRHATNYRIEETWDTLGMRATTSHDTILERTFVPDDAVILVCPAGFAGAGLFHVALFAWALLGFAGVYSWIARRPYDETITVLRGRHHIGGHGQGRRRHHDQAERTSRHPRQQRRLRAADATRRPLGDGVGDATVDSGRRRPWWRWRPGSATRLT